MAKKGVCAVFDRADELGIGYDDVADKDDDEACRPVFPGRFRVERIFEQPDWDYVRKELGRVCATLLLLHAEYADACVRTGGVHMSYSTFCREHDGYIVSRDLASHIERKAGRSIEVDQPGPAMSIVDAAAGEVSKAYLLAASLPYGRYDHVEPTLDMKQDAWPPRHVRMFEFYGGSVPRLVPDNLKAGVAKHPKEGEVVLDDACREMAARRSAAALPARAVHPKDKPNAEGAVGNIAADIIAALRGTAFASFAELKLAVPEKPAEHSARPFQKREGSRLQCFEDEERGLLQPLPAVPCEIGERVRNRKAVPNRHVAHAENRYSCSWRYVGQYVDLRATDAAVEVYKGAGRIAVHPPPWATSKCSTRERDVPESKAYCEWDAERVRRWADRVEPACAGCVNRIFESVKFDEQGFDAALVVLRLSKAYSAQRLEAACALALEKVAAPRCKHIRPILETSQDKTRNGTTAAPAPIQEAGGHVRGADYCA